VSALGVQIVLLNAEVARLRFDLDRLTRGLEAMHNNGGRHANWIVANLLAGREWNDDGTALKGGTDG
jgi:hypothetical protein